MKTQPINKLNCDADLRRRNFLQTTVAASALHALSWSAFANDSPHHHGQANSPPRFTNRLRLPGEGGLFMPLRFKDVQSIAVVPHALPLFAKHSKTPLWLYRTQSANRTVHNPILFARTSDQIKLSLSNQIAQPTIVHWHGLTNDQKNDGAGLHLIRHGQRYSYDFQIHNAAGVHWYHPHPHEQAGEQTWRGLASMLIVEDEYSDALARSLGTIFGQTDIPLILQDRTIEKNGRMPYSQNKKRWFHGMGGDEVLINLTRKPYLNLPRRWVRFRLLNASNARSYRLAWRPEHSEHNLPFYILGTDGGLLPAPQQVAEAWLAAGQRLDMALNLSALESTQRIHLYNLAFDPLHQEMGMNMQAEMGHAHTQKGEGAFEPLLQINLHNATAASNQLGQLPNLLHHQTETIKYNASHTPNRRFMLDHHEGQWRINGKTFHESHHAFTVARGAQEIWEIQNATASMPHPMHLHGFHFSVLERVNSPEQWRVQEVDALGRAVQDQGLLDTVLVWPGETVRLAIHFKLPSTAAFSEEQHYMFHCHNLEHEDMGMMLGFSVST